MQKLPRTIVVTLLMLVGLGCSQAPDENSATADLGYPAVFIDSTGKPHTLEPGTYTLTKAADSELELSGDSLPDTLRVAALGIDHDEALEEPLALAVAGEANTTHLVLLSADGSGWEAMGSSGRVMPRAGSPRKQLSRERIKKETTLEKERLKKVVRKESDVTLSPEETQTEPPPEEPVGMVGPAPAIAPSTFDVPNVIDKSLADAQAIITRAGLAIGQITSISNAAPPGIVIGQSPAPCIGCADAGAPVNLTVSEGTVPVKLDVPAIIGKALVDAEAIILRAGLLVGQITRVSNAAPAGIVIGQSPAPCIGCADAGLPINLTVSAGPPPADEPIPTSAPPPTYPTEPIPTSEPPAPTGPVECDLAARFVAPEGNTLPGKAAIEWQLEFRNLGQTACKSNSVYLSRFSGTSPSGSGLKVGGSAGNKSLPSLAGGQAILITLNEAVSPETGTFSYSINYSSPMNDVNNNNHKIYRTVNYASIGSGPIPQPQVCDLTARVMLPTATSLPGGAPQTWEVFFLNTGSGPCPGNQVFVGRFRTDMNVPPAEVGGVENRQVLNALPSRGSQSIQFQESDTPSNGVYRYQLGYGAPFTDVNNENHRFVRQISYEGGGQFGAFNAINVTVEVTEGGQAAANADVCAFSDSNRQNQVGATQPTDADGRATISLEAGNYFWYAFKNGNMRSSEQSVTANSSPISLALFGNGSFQNDCAPPPTDTGDGGGDPVVDLDPSPVQVPNQPPRTVSASELGNFGLNVNWSPVTGAELYEVTVFQVTWSAVGDFLGYGNLPAPIGAALYEAWTDEGIQHTPSIMYQLTAEPAQFTVEQPSATVRFAEPINQATQLTRGLGWSVRACNTQGFCGAPGEGAALVNIPFPDGGLQPTNDLRTWNDIRPVFQHPRCVNCHEINFNSNFVPPNHVAVNFDTPVGVGGTTSCSGCHDSTLPAGGGIKDIPWQPVTDSAMRLTPYMNAAPGSAGDRALCTEIATNPGTIASNLEEHLLLDPLILWGVGPEPELPNGTTTSALPAGQDWTQLVNAWLAAGTPCPQ